MSVEYKVTDTYTAQGEHVRVTRENLTKLKAKFGNRWGMFSLAVRLLRDDLNEGRDISVTIRGRDLRECLKDYAGDADKVVQSYTAPSQSTGHLPLGTFYALVPPGHATRSNRRKLS